MKKVIAIIVSYDSSDHTVACLDAIGRSAYPVAAVHVCENAGPKAFAELAEALAPEGTPTGDHDLPRVVRTLHARRGDLAVHLHEADGNLGYAGGVNLCLAAIRDEDWDAVFILNPDSLVDRDAVGALVAYTDGTDYGIVGCRLVLEGNGRIQMYAGRWRAWIGRTRNLGFREARDAVPDTAAIEREMNFVCGAAMFATRAFVDAIGPMEEDYFLYMEEVDWCFRSGRFRLGYAHGAIVVHSHGVSTGASTLAGQRSALSIYLNERNKLRFTRRFYPLRYPVVLLTTFAYNLLYLKRGGYRTFRHALAGWFAGIRDESGPPPARRDLGGKSGWSVGP